MVVKQVPPVSPLEIKAFTTEERNKKAAEVHQAVVIVHGLLTAAEVYVDFLKHYQFIIDNKKFRKYINDTFLENKLFLREIDKVFKSSPSMEEHIQEQEDFSYSLLDKLEEVVTNYTADEFGFSIARLEDEGKKDFKKAITNG
jgi:predicted house-cleaning noncanonical NTP pyrophosphatase (MazG superfamily)